ncbi:site-specific integrase [Tetragenococcus halophilus]|nr:site-specific integrase [Tetragenococcus halophilus]
MLSVRKDRKNRNWLLDISTTNPVTGRRKRIVRKNFSSKKEAESKEQELRIVLLDQKMPKEIYTVQLLFELLMIEDSKDKKISYLTSQKYNYHAHIEEYFRDAIISRLNYQSIITFRENLIAKGLNNNTVNKIMVLLKKILDVAIRYQVLEVNPCRLIKKLPLDKTQMCYWTLEEYLAFDQSISSHEKIFKVFFRIAFFTGMRKGEILALKWEDIDFKQSIIYVNKTVIKINGKEYFSDTKTKAGMRCISINQKLTSFLKEWKGEQQGILRSYYKEDSLETIRVFEVAPFCFLDSGNIRKKYEKLLKRNSKLKPIRIHDFRHSHVAMLINFGADPYLIKERLGHESIQTTYDIYGHLYPSKQKTIADQIDLLIDS